MESVQPIFIELGAPHPDCFSKSSKDNRRELEARQEKNRTKMTLVSNSNSTREREGFTIFFMTFYKSA